MDNSAIVQFNHVTNLRSLRFDRHIGRFAEHVSITVPAENVKNRKHLHFKLPRRLSERIRRYVDVWRCLFFDGTNPHLIMITRDRYGFPVRRTKGTCSNDRVLERDILEHLVLNGLKKKLIEFGSAKEFIKEFNSQFAARTTADKDKCHRTEHVFKQAEKKLTAILSAIEQGIVTETTRTCPLELEREKSALERQLSEPEAAPYPSIHPDLGNLYRCQVAALEETPSDPGIRLEAVKYSGP